MVGDWVSLWWVSWSARIAWSTEVGGHRLRQEGHLERGRTEIPEEAGKVLFSSNLFTRWANITFMTIMMSNRSTGKEGRGRDEGKEGGLVPASHDPLLLTLPRILPAFPLLTGLQSQVSASPQWWIFRD